MAKTQKPKESNKFQRTKTFYYTTIKKFII